MIRWERLGALGVPAVVIAALACLVRGAWMFGEPFGWLAGFVALLFIALVLDREPSEKTVPIGIENVENTVARQQQMRAVR